MKKNLLVLILSVNSSLILAAAGQPRAIAQQIVPGKEVGETIPQVKSKNITTNRKVIPTKLTPATQNKLSSTLGITKNKTATLAHATTIVIACCSDEVKDKDVSPLIHRHFPQLSISERNTVVKHIMNTRNATPGDTTTPVNEVALAVETIVDALKTF